MGSRLTIGVAPRLLLDRQPHQTFFSFFLFWIAALPDCMRRADGICNVSVWFVRCGGGWAEGGQQGGGF